MPISSVDFDEFEFPDIGTNSTLYTATGTKDLVLSCIISNITAGSVNVTVEIVRTGGTPIASVVTDAPVPPGGSLEIVSNKPIVLSTGDLIRATASSATSLDASGSIMVTS
jgi:hypothetical protein